MDLDIQKLRQQIPACRDTIYLNSGWSGPSPLPVIERIREQLEYEAAHGPASPDSLPRIREVFQQAQGAAADLLGSSQEEVTLTHNTTEGINLVMQGLPWEKGDELVTCDLEHPAILVPAYFLQRRGVALRIVPVSPADSAARILAKVGEALGPKTRLVALSHIQFTCGLTMPIREIASLAHRHGSLLLVDGAQTAGQIPLNVVELGCDYYAYPSQKWLLGPAGVGALYVRRELIPGLAPILVGGGATASHDRQGGYVPEPGLRKFHLSTSSSALAAGFAQAIALARSTGLEQIRQRCLDLAFVFRHRVARIPRVSVFSPERPEEACGLVALDLGGVPPKKLLDYLWSSRRIAARVVGYPSGVRFSWHYFNTQEEVEAVAEALAQASRDLPQEQNVANSPPAS